MDSDTLGIHCPEEHMATFKAAQAEQIEDATQRVAANQFVQLDALQQEVAAVMHANKQCQAKIRWAEDANADDRKKTLYRHRLVL